MDIRDYVRLLRRRWLQILLIAFVAGVAQASSLLFRRTTPVYVASADMVLKETPLELGFLPTATGAGTPIVPLKTRIGLITTRVIAEPAVKRLEALNIRLTVDEVLGSLSVRSTSDVNTVTVTAETDNPDKSRAIAQETCEAFKSWFEADVTKSFRNTRNVLDRQLEAAEKKLAQTSAELREFLRKSIQGRPARPDLQFEKRLDGLLDLETQKGEVDGEIRFLDQQLKRQIPGQPGYEIMPETSAGAAVSFGRSEARSESAGAIVQQMGAAQERLAVLREKCTDEHPDVIALQMEIRKLTERLENETLAAHEERRTELRRQRERLRDQAKSIDDRIEAGWSQLGDMQDRIEGYQDLLARRNDLREQRKAILHEQLRLDQREAEEGGGNRVEIARKAGPGAPKAPLAGVSIPLMLIISAAIGVGGGYFLDFIQSTLRTPVDVRNYLDLPTISSIPFIRFEPVGLLDVALKSPVYELYNKLATFLQTAALEQRARTMLVISAKAGEGKSTIVSNLAIALAQSGERVVLIDADLRRPVLHQIFGLDNARGLSGVLAGELEADRQLAESTGRPLAGLDQYLQATSIPTLQVLTSGPAPMNPIHLLKSPHLAHFLSEVKLRANYILFDAPPVLGVIDGAILAGHSDITLFIVAENTVSRGEAAQCKHALNQVGANLLGVILNKVHYQPEAYYYYYYRYRGYE